MSTENDAAEAIMGSRWEQARELLHNGAPLSGRYVENNKGQIINSIFRSRAFDLVDKLIENGVIETDVYEYDSFDRSVFKNIVQSLGTDEASLQFLKDFLKKIKHPNADVRDQTILGFCMEEGANPLLVSCLIAEGCDPQYKNNADMNLLHAVAGKPMLDGAKGAAYIGLLLDQGVDVHARNVEGTTPLMVAVKRNRPEYLTPLLQAGADPNEADNKGETAFYQAVVHGQSLALYNKLREYVTPDFEKANRDGDFILPGYLRMSGGSSADLLLQLIADGADLYQASPYYNQPKSGVDWLAEKSPDLLKVVLASGVIDPDRQDDAGNTLLHKVCAFNVNYEQEAAKRTYQKVKLLLEAGATPDITNNNEETPLILASKDNLKARTVELLMERTN